MQNLRNPLTIALGKVLLPAALCAVAASGCGTDPAVLESTTVTIAVPTADPIAARDRDVAWIYHLGKTHATDDLAERLDHDRERLSALAAVHAGSQPQNVLATEPPHSAVPVAAGSQAPGALPTSAATPAPVDPLSNVPVQLDPAIVLALYHIDPETNAQLFIRNYPTTADGVQHDYGVRLVKSRLTKDGESYPIEELARYAATSDVAAAKLYTAATVANGELADRYATAIALLAKDRPGDLLPMLVRLPMSARLGVASEPVGWCAHRPDAILAAAPADPAQLAIERDIRATTAHCKEVLAAHAAALALDEPVPPAKKGHAKGPRPTPRPTPDPTASPDADSE